MAPWGPQAEINPGCNPHGLLGLGGLQLQGGFQGRRQSPAHQGCPPQHHGHLPYSFGKFVPGTGKGFTTENLALHTAQCSGCPGGQGDGREAGIGGAPVGGPGTAARHPGCSSSDPPGTWNDSWSVHVISQQRQEQHTFPERPQDSARGGLTFGPLMQTPTGAPSYLHLPCALLPADGHSRPPHGSCQRTGLGGRAWGDGGADRSLLQLPVGPWLLLLRAPDKQQPPGHTDAEPQSVARAPGPTGGRSAGLSAVSPPREPRRKRPWWAPGRLRKGHRCPGVRPGEPESPACLLSLGMWMLRPLARTAGSSPRRSRKCTCMHTPAHMHAHTHGHSLPYNSQELMESVNPGREPQDERKSYIF